MLSYIYTFFRYFSYIVFFLHFCFTGAPHWNFFFCMSENLCVYACLFWLFVVRIFLFLFHCCLIVWLGIYFWCQTFPSVLWWYCYWDVYCHSGLITFLGNLSSLGWFLGFLSLPLAFWNFMEVCSDVCCYYWLYFYLGRFFIIKRYLFVCLWSFLSLPSFLLLLCFLLFVVSIFASRHRIICWLPGSVTHHLIFSISFHLYSF